MARLSDVPPEVRLKIYQLLLVDPIREGQRITFIINPIESTKTTRGRACCVQDESPHESPDENKHYTHPCRIDNLPSALHHLDFTDLMSLARTNKTHYMEASPIIYNNADLTFASSQSPPAPRFAVTTTLLSRFLEQHHPSTLAMFRTLNIHDESGTLSTQDTRSIVDLVNTQIPNLHDFAYHLYHHSHKHEAKASASIAPFQLLHICLRQSCRALRTLQPFARLRAGIRTSLDADLPKEFGLLDSMVRYSICDLKRRYIIRALDDLRDMAKRHRRMHDYHAFALDQGDYLHVTLGLRSMSLVNEDELSDEELDDMDDIEHMLVGMRIIGNGIMLRRQLLQCALETERAA